ALPSAMLCSVRYFGISRSTWRHSDPPNGRSMEERLSVLETAKHLYSKIYSIPVIGYSARLVIALAKLPRINMHLRRVDQFSRVLQQRWADAQQKLDKIDARWHEQQHWADAQQKLDKIDAGWHQHVPAFLNAVSSVGAFGHQLARQHTDVQERNKRVD